MPDDREAPAGGETSSPCASAASRREGALERERLVGRASVVGAGTLASRILGLVRDMTMAALFTTVQTDAFWVAFRMPNALRQLLAEGAVSSAVVPVLSARLAEGGDEAGRAFFARARGISLLALLVVSLAGVLAARPLTELFAPGYHDIPGQFERTVTLTRVMFPYIFFMGTAALGMAALNAKRRFAVAAFAPALLNVALVAAALLLPGLFAAFGLDASLALGVGALLGGGLQVLAQAPALQRIGFAGRPRLDLRDPAVREMFRRIVPMTFGVGVYYVDIVLSGRFLSELGTGAQSYFSWAMRVCDFPQGIFVMAISTAALPSLATLAARGDIEQLKNTWAHGLRLALFVAIPASVALVALGEPIVVMLFQRGKFDAAMAHETARALAWQGGAVFTVSAVRQLVLAFHSLGDTRTPVVVSALDLVAFIVLALVLRGPFGHVGISMAIAGSSAVQMVLLAAALRKKLGDIRGGEILSSSTRVVLASLVAAAGGWGAARGLTGVVGGPVGKLVPCVASGTVFAALFLVAAWGLGARELDELAGPVRRP